MAKLTALVTSGGGYIGPHVCKALGRAGYHPAVLDNLQYGHERAVKWGPLTKGTTELVSTRSLLPTPPKPSFTS